MKELKVRDSKMTTKLYTILWCFAFVVAMLHC